MANAYGINHDTDYDATIKSQLEASEHGSWTSEGGARVFTPKMSFFSLVPAHMLASYFVEHDTDEGGGDLRLNLP